MMRPRHVRYVRSQGYDLAWHDFGVGDSEVLMVWGAPNHIEGIWTWPSIATFLRGLAGLGRVVEYDMRGTGLSDRVSVSELASAREHALDAVAVMDAAGFDRPLVVAETSAAPIAVELAVRHSDRVSQLALLSPDFSGMIDDGLLPAVLDMVEHHWGEPLLIETFFPTLATDPRYVEWYCAHQRGSASPSAARALVEMDQQSDVTSLLELINVPTLVLGREHDDLLDLDRLAEQAAIIPEHQFVITEGDGHFYGTGPGDAAAVDAIARFAGRPDAGEIGPDIAERAVLFTDIVGSTSLLSEIGDAEWRRLMDRHDRAMAEVVAMFGGEFVKGTGDGVLATFGDVERAVGAASVASDRLGDLGIRIRAGVHHGPLELRGDDIAGLAVTIAARVADKADAGEVVLTANDAAGLAPGTGFTSKGRHTLKGVEQPIELIAVHPDRVDRRAP